MEKHLLLKRLYENQDGRCGICGKSLKYQMSKYDKWWQDRGCMKRTKANINIDHIYPKSKLKSQGWWDDESNLQVTHITCNRKKGDSV